MNITANTKDLMLRTLALITVHPENHNQTAWAVSANTGCGTACCVAGWAAVLSGRNLDWRNLPDGSWAADWLLMEGDEYGLHISNYARDVLGLDAYERDRLFFAENTLERIHEIVADLLGLTEDELVAELEVYIEEWEVNGPPLGYGAPPVEGSE